MFKKLAIAVILFLLALGIITGCAASEKTKETSTADEKRVIKIAEQYGLAYAPIAIMKEKKMLEEKDESLSVQWKTLSNTAAIREAMLVDDLDIGFMGIPPFMIAYNNKMDWKIFTGLSSSPLGLVVNDENIKTLDDLTIDKKIVLPQPGSIQHILLSMAAEKKYSDAKRFDKQLISMKHPDGFTALVSRSGVSGHFTSPPFLFEEVKVDGNHLLLSGEEAFGGEFTFIVGAAETDFLKEREDDVLLVRETIKEAMDFIDENREETIKILSKKYNVEESVLEDYMYNRGMSYELQVKGIDRFAAFLYENDYLNKPYEEEDLIWGN